MKTLALAALAALQSPGGSHELKLDLRMPDGTAPESAVVLYHHGGNINESSIGRWKGPEEAVRLFADEGTLRVYVDPIEWRRPGFDPKRDHPEYSRFEGALLAPFASEALELDLEEIGDELLRIDLEPVPHVRLEVHPAEGEPLPDGLIVETEKVHPRGHRWGPKKMGRFGGGFDMPSTRIREGVVEVYRLPVEQTSFVHVGVAGRAPLASLEVIAEDRTTEHAVTLRSLAAGAVRFRVLGLPADEGPQDGLRILRNTWGERGGIAGGCTVEDDTDGWQRALLAPGDMTHTDTTWTNLPTTTILSAEHGDFGVLAHRVEPGAAPIEFRFEPPVHLVVHLTNEKRNKGLDYRLSPVGMRRVTAAVGSSRKERERLGPIQPGRYLLEIVHPHPSSKRSSTNGLLLHSEEILVESGQRKTVEVTLPAIGDVHVVSKTLPPGSTVFLGPPDFPDDKLLWSRSARAKLDADGRATFKDVPAGHHVLRSGTWYRPLAIGPDEGRSEDTPIAFNPEGTHVGRVRLITMAGHLWDAGFQEGDLVLGEDGAPFDSPRKAYSFPSRARGDVVALLVRRGTQTLELELGPLEQAPSREWQAQLGGWIEPAWVD